MSNTQADAVPNDANATPIPQVIPAKHGDIRSILIALPSGVASKLSTLAGDDYPTADDVKGPPEITGWIVVNEQAETIRAGGSNVSATIGYPIPDGSGSPQPLGLQTDPGKTYLFQASGATVNLQLILMGNLVD